MAEKKNENEMSQDEAIQELMRKRFKDRMEQVQTETDQQIKGQFPQQQQQQEFDPTTHCKHGMPLERFCKKCDLITADQVQDSKPMGVTRPTAPNKWVAPTPPKKEE